MFIPTTISLNLINLHYYHLVVKGQNKMQTFFETIVFFPLYRDQGRDK